ncbi:MAG TPA: VCBS repeat-containing protein [Planctomycetota bacterium]|nr:VCBS repeat-containing protein [Planctomycetota bacterium]
MAAGRPSRAAGLQGLAAVLVFVARLSPCQTPLYTFAGTVPEGRFGWCVDGAGDVDGDGTEDLIVGAPEWSYPIPGPGYARVFSGAGGTLLFEFTGPALYDFFGDQVAGAGDVDADGFDDFVITTATFPSGAARVYSGTSGSLLYLFPPPPSTPAFAAAVSGAGDVNGDGFEDIIVGAPAWGFPSPGQAFVYSGATGTVIQSWAGSIPLDLFGASVHGIGDVDGDGLPDVAVGAPGAGSTGAPLGYVRVFSGGTGNLLFDITGPSGPLEYFGRVVAGGGDVDADGVPDFAVTAPGYPAGSSFGRVLVFSGSSAAVLLDRTGNTYFEGFGASVDLVGDLNGDGSDDLAVGVGTGGPAPCGSPGSRIEIVSGDSGTSIYSYPGATPYSDFGASVAAVGDLDGDGSIDVAAGAPGLSGMGAMGSVTVLSFSPGPSLTFLGAGCPGSGGVVPSIGTAGGAATSAGNPAFAITLNNALGGAACDLVVGIGAVPCWLGTALPFTLSSFGMPACDLYVAPEFVVNLLAGGAGPGGGSAFFPIPIPPSPTLSGERVRFQWYVRDPGPSLVPGAMSPALEIRIQ